MLQTILAFVLGIAVTAIVVSSRGNRRRPFIPFKRPTEHDEQLSAVINGNVSFHKKQILQPREYRAYAAAKKVLEAHGRNDWLVWAQVCIGELITTEPYGTPQAATAHSSINSKRSDIVITDGKGYPIAFIEYQGKDHYQHTALQRDAIKRLVAERAQIKFIEVMGSWSNQQIEDAIRNQLGL